jgi:hypothetical protein
MWIHNRKLAAFHGANNFGEMYLISMRLRPTEVFRIHVVISCIAHTKTAKLFILCVSNKVKGEKTILDQHLCQVYMHKHLYIASVPSTLCALNCSWRGKIIGMKLMLENGCSCSYHVTKNFITPNITSKFSWDSTIKRCCKKKCAINERLKRHQRTVPSIKGENEEYKFSHHVAARGINSITDLSISTAIMTLKFYYDVFTLLDTSYLKDWREICFPNLSFGKQLSSRTIWHPKFAKQGGK